MVVYVILFRVLDLYDAAHCGDGAIEDLSIPPTLFSLPASFFSPLSFPHFK